MVGPFVYTFFIKQKEECGGLEMMWAVSENNQINCIWPNVYLTNNKKNIHEQSMLMRHSLTA